MAIRASDTDASPAVNFDVPRTFAELSLTRGLRNIESPVFTRSGEGWVGTQKVSGARFTVAARTREIVAVILAAIRDLFLDLRVRKIDFRRLSVKEKMEITEEIKRRATETLRANLQLYPDLRSKEATGRVHIDATVGDQSLATDIAVLDPVFRDLLMAGFTSHGFTR
jgi:hypothetical protein